MKLIRIAFSVLVIALVMMGGASAALIIFSGVDAGANSNNPRPLSNAAAALFDAAGNETIIDFEAAALGAFTNLVVAPGVIMNGSDISANPQTIQNTPVDSPDGLFGYNTTTTAGATHFVSLQGGTLTFTFATPIEDFGAYFSGVQLNGETMSFNDGAPQLIPIPNPGSGVQFLGFTDFGRSISSITISVANDIVGVDDVRVSSAAPEPATLALFGIAVAGLGFSRRRKSI